MNNKFDSLDGKRVRIIKDEENSFTIIEPKSKEHIKVYINKDDELSLNNPKIEKLKINAKSSSDNSKSFFTKSSFNLIEMLVTIFIVIILSMVVSLYARKNVSLNNSNNISYEDNNSNEFIKLYKDVISNYYNKIDSSDLDRTLTDSLVDYLKDKYSDYLDIYEARNLEDRLKGEYNGFGIELSTVNDEVVITNVFNNTPAYNEGVKAGDKLISVGGIEVKGKTSGEVSILIKDRINNRVPVIVDRGGELLTFSLEKKNIVVESVHKDIFDNIGYIKIDTFSNTTYKQFEESLKTLEEENISSLIIDLRNNNGGYINVAYNIADLFIGKGNIIYKLETNKKLNIYKAVKDETRSYKIAVIVNEESASASEVLTLALKDSYGITVVGTKSFGKGTVQETLETSSGGLVKYTVASWYGPNDENINGIGITPDVKISNGQKYINNPIKENDRVLSKAIEILK